MLLGSVVTTFVFGRRQIAETRMEPLLIVHVINKAAKLCLGVSERLVRAEVDLLDSLNANDKTAGAALPG